MKFEFPAELTAAVARVNVAFDDRKKIEGLAARVAREYQEAKTVADAAKAKVERLSVAEAMAILEEDRTLSTIRRELTAARADLAAAEEIIGKRAPLEAGLAQKLATVQAEIEAAAEAMYPVEQSYITGVIAAFSDMMSQSLVGGLGLAATMRVGHAIASGLRADGLTQRLNEILVHDPRWDAPPLLAASQLRQPGAATPENLTRSWVGNEDLVELVGRLAALRALSRRVESQRQLASHRRQLERKAADRAAGEKMAANAPKGGRFEPLPPAPPAPGKPGVAYEVRRGVS